MGRKKKALKREEDSTRKLMGIDEVTSRGIQTQHGKLVYFIVKPTNIGVLSAANIGARIFALMNVLKGVSDIEMLALNSKESFEKNKNFYRSRMEVESNPQIRKLLEQDAIHLDHIQAQMASSREFYIIIRPQLDERESELASRLTSVEKSIRDHGFTTHRTSEQELKKMLGIYYEQNVTTERYEDYDGDRWLILNE